MRFAPAQVDQKEVARLVGFAQLRCQVAAHVTDRRKAETISDTGATT